MALSTYSELQTEIASWLDRSDLTAQIPTFIKLAEARINRTLRVRAMETVVQHTMVGLSKRIALPSDYLQMRGLKFSSDKIATTTLNGEISDSVDTILLTSAADFTATGTILIGTEQITYTGKSTNTLTGCVRGANSTTAALHVDGSTVDQIYTSWTEGATLSTGVSTLYVLKYVSPEILTSVKAGSTSGVPSVYTMSAGHILFGPVPASYYTCEMVYYQKIPALTDAAPTNWCLTANPDLFLYGSLVEAEPFLMNDQRVQLWGLGFEKGMADLEEQDAKDQFSGSELRVFITSGYY